MSMCNWPAGSGVGLEKAEVFLHGGQATHCSFCSLLLFLTITTIIPSGSSMQCSIQRANNQLPFVTGRGSGQWVNFATRQILLLGFPIRKEFLKKKKKAPTKKGRLLFLLCISFHFETLQSMISSGDNRQCGRWERTQLWGKLSTRIL